LGTALIAWAGAAGRDEWADIGRSLILSVLSWQDNNGTVPAFIEMSESGGFTASTGGTLSAATIYKIISPGEYYPRAVVIGSAVNGLWAWTVASAVTAVQENNVLDIAAYFPVGETHHMMIRGVRPFYKIQIYNIDYPTDSQFESYDSSGWVYSAQEQILTVKLKHREPAEHIKIFY
jgi:predicted DNA-binding transcriptional regulator AlpA